MKETEINQYCNIMEEIKLRIKVIDYFLFGAGHSLYEATTLESVSLQLRKILELTAMATLVANKKEYAKVYSNFAKTWNAEYLLKDLARINSKFYPVPIIKEQSDEVGLKRNLVDRPNDYLTKEEFIKVYKKCGSIMHASNPLGRKIGYEYYKKNLPEWRQKVLNLLNTHKIHLLNETGFYLIHMKEEKDDKVHFYTFGRHEKASS